MFLLHRRCRYYALLIVVLAIYRWIIGGTPESSLYIATACLATLILAAAAVRYRVAPFINAGPIVARQQRYFAAEFSAYCFAAAGAFLVDVLWLDQPVMTVLRYAALVVVFGYLSSIETTLAKILDWLEVKDSPFKGPFRIVPDVWRLALLPWSIVVAMAAPLSLAAYVFSETLNTSAASNDALLQGLLADVIVTLLVVGGISLLVIRSYAHNLKTVIDRHIQVLKDVQADDYSGEVPIVSNDALGMLASQINRVVEYLRERGKVYDVLKRIVSPGIMEKLVRTDSASLKRGHSSQLAILFCDIRGFTTASESSSAEEMLLFLNSYFSDMSDLVSAHNGIVNKFLGDGILAVYGMDHPANSATDAFNTATDIVAHSEGFILPDGSVPQVGIGIHFGTVVAGTVGSEHRYEYTFLGDTVNTASRLEGLSKRLGYKIILSAEAFHGLEDGLRDELAPLGRHRVRGKSESLEVYGAVPAGPSR